MNVCVNCGADNSDGAELCVRCGIDMTNLDEPQEASNDKVNIILAILSFIVPVLGLILGGVYRYSAPRAARIYLLGAAVLIGLFIVVLSAMFVIIPIVTMVTGKAV